MSKIEWTGKTWNPVVGCTVHSPGCRGCYAMGEAWRKQFHPNDAIRAKYAGTVEKTKAGQLLWTGKLNFSERALGDPLRRRTPTTWFVNSMSDLFHEDMPDEWIDRVFTVMALCPQHTFQVLTKRADRMREHLLLARGQGEHWLAHIAGAPVAQWPLPNVWLGVSVEDQARADKRVPDLLATPAAVRFLSCEPLLGPVNLTRRPIPESHYEDWLAGEAWDDVTGDITPDLYGANHGPKIDWVIAGGESGPTARPMHPLWAQSLRDQCAAAGAPFFFKQWGEWRFVGRLYDDAGDTDETVAAETVLIDHTADDAWTDERKCLLVDGGLFNWANERAQPPSDVVVLERSGKKASGRLLDGIEHNGMPGHG